jgi:hypothetical protein
VELCDLLGVDRPDPSVAKERHNSYVFEKSVPLPGGTHGRIDLYKRGCFVMEAKQGSDQIPVADVVGSRRRGTAVRGTAAWDTAMERALQQAQSYARNLPPDEIPGGRPPLLVVVDLGDSIALYSEFTRTGGSYVPFPDPASAADVAGPFGRRNKARVDRVTELLEMLVLLGQAVIHAEGRYAAG